MTIQDNVIDGVKDVNKGAYGIIVNNKAGGQT